MAANAATAELPGNAACNCPKPVVSGVKLPPDEKGAAPMRCRSKFPEPKNQSLFLQIGPPNVPPKRLST